MLQKQQQSETMVKTRFLQFGVSMDLFGCGLAEIDPTKRASSPRLGTPRARATEPGRDHNFRVVYRWPPCVPRSRKCEKRRGRKTKGCLFAKKVHLVHTHIVGRAFARAVFAVLLDWRAAQSSARRGRPYSPVKVRCTGILHIPGMYLRWCDMQENAPRRVYGAMTCTTRAQRDDQTRVALARSHY